MSTVQVKPEVGLEDMQQALSNALGPTYRVSAKSDSTLRVYRNPVIWATVRVSWSAGSTTVRVSSGGLVAVKLINALTITPRIRKVLNKAFPGAS